MAGASGWTTFESAFTSSLSAPASEGTNVLKMFGPFVTGGATGAFQNGFAVNPGELVNASVQVQNWSSDPLTNIGIFQVGFFDAGGGNLVNHDIVVDDTLASDTWTELSHSLVAPTGAATVQVFLLHVQVNDPVTGGSIFWDDASLTISAVPEPATFGIAALGVVGLVVRRRRK